MYVSLHERLANYTTRKTYRDRGTPSRLVLHRCTVPGVDKSDGMHRAYHDMSTRQSAGSWTGGKVPYHSLYVPGARELKVFLPHWAKSPHARSWNAAGYGLAIYQDFRASVPSEKTWLDLLQIVDTLTGLWDIPVEAVAGHTEHPGASADPHKDCPGRFFDLERFRFDLVRCRSVDSPLKSHSDVALIAHPTITHCL